MEQFVQSKYCIAIYLLLILNLFYQANSQECDYFRGHWVLDKSYPLYDSLECPFVRREFSCLRNGRPDKLYQYYRWQPYNCQLPNFDGVNFLEKLRGKSVMFVGDSISQDHWESLACILHKQVPQAKYKLVSKNNVQTLTFTEYEVKLMMNLNHYLVDIVYEREGTVLKIDSVEIGAKQWEGVDILIFNSFHWWDRKSWDFVQIGNKLVKERIDGIILFEKALKTWARWADTIDPSKTKLFFQGISPTHYNGSEWNEPKANSCIGQTEPILGMTYSTGPPFSLTVMKRALNTILEKKTATLLDITTLSQLRKDGHPSLYGQEGKSGKDCLHWCLGGVPDTWNQILYALIFHK